MNLSDALKKELDRPVAKGISLSFAMLDSIGGLGDEDKDKLKKNNITLPNFKSDYDAWYTLAMQVVKQVLPDRIDDFIKQYKNEKRKEIDSLTYTVSDFLLGIQTTRGLVVVAEPSAAFPKFEIQLNILKSAQACFDSKILDIKEVLQADIFDSELDAAGELCKKGFVRGAGAVAGVLLEKHLTHICERHNLATGKKTPTINDLNQKLKDGSVIDTPKWRFIQHLGDIRNLCDLSKDREPTKEQVSELIQGVDKVIKTVF